jgi:alkanesulfonate monooxygenase
VTADHRRPGCGIAEYHEIGLDHFILSGQPHVEEALWFGEGVLPLLSAHGLTASTAPDPAISASL